MQVQSELQRTTKGGERSTWVRFNFGSRKSWTNAWRSPWCQHPSALGPPSRGAPRVRLAELSFVLKKTPKNTGQSSKQSLWMYSALFIKYCLCLVLGEHMDGVQWLFVGKCWLCIFGCLLGCLGMSLQRRKSTSPSVTSARITFPLQRGKGG